MQKIQLPIFTALLALTSPALALPLSFTHHGVLLEDEAYVSGTRHLIVTLYAGSEAIAQKEDDVEIQAGHYTLTLDNIPVEEIKNATNLVLGVNVDGEELLPRLPVKSVPYALVSSYASTAGGLDCEGCISAKQLDFIASEDFQLPSCNSYEVMRAQGSGWECSSAVKIADGADNSPTLYLQGAIALNAAADGSTPAHQYSYQAAQVSTSQPDTAPCECDEEENGCSPQGFTTTTDNGQTCYDFVGNDLYRLFQRDTILAPVDGLMVVKDQQLGLGTGTPAANLHVRALNGADKYELILADTQPEILLEDLDGTNFKIAAVDGSLTISSPSQAGDNPALVTINDAGLSVNGQLSASSFGSDLQIGQNNVNFLYAGSTSKGGPASAIASNTVNSDKIADGTILGKDLKSGTIEATQLAANSVTTAKILDNNVTNAKIVDAAISNSKLADSSVDSTKIANYSIKAEDIAQDAITTVKILDSNVTTAKIANLAITEGKINSNAVTTAKIKDEAVTTAKLESTLQSAIKLANNSLQKTSGSVTSTYLATGAVGSTQLAANAVTEGKIATSAVTNTKIANLAVTNGKLAANAVTTDKISNGTIIAEDLASGSVGSTQLADSAVTEAKIADSAVTSAKIADGAVTKDKIADSAVSNAKLANGSVSNAKISNGAVTQAKLSNIYPAKAWGSFTFSCSSFNSSSSCAQWTAANKTYQGVSTFAQTANTAAKYRITLTKPMADTNYAVIANGYSANSANTTITGHNTFLTEKATDHFIISMDTGSISSGMTYYLSFVVYGTPEE